MNKRVLTNFLWRFFERVGAELVAFAVSIVLARLLSPAEYGTLAIVSVIIVLFQVFVDSGLGNALIQKKDVDELDYSTVFFFNIAMCVILYTILFIIAPYFANFYGDSSLTPILRVLGIVIIISGVKNIQQAYVTKSMMFKKFFFSTLIGTITAAIVGIVMALNGYGVWALVAQQLVNTAIDTCVLWFTVNFRPHLRFSLIRLKTIFGYGSKLLLTGLLGTLYNNINQLCVGKVFTSTDLAYYNKGKSWPNLLVNNVNTSLDSILLPVFSENQDDENKLLNQTKQTIELSSFVIFPMMMGLAIVAKPLTSIVLTEKWLPSVIFLQIFCLSYATYPLQTANINVMKATGNSGDYLKCEILKRIIQLMFLLIGLKKNVLAVGIGFALTNLMACVIFSCPNRRTIHYWFPDQFKDMRKTIISVFIMAIVCKLSSFWISNKLILVIFQVVVGIIVYIIVSLLLKNESLEKIYKAIFSTFF